MNTEQYRGFRSALRGALVLSTMVAVSACGAEDSPAMVNAAGSSANGNKTGGKGGATGSGDATNVGGGTSSGGSVSNGPSTGGNATGSNSGGSNSNSGGSSSNNSSGTTGNSGGTTGNAGGSTANTGGSTGKSAGTTGNSGGTTGNTGGTIGNSGGTNGKSAGTTGNSGGTTGNTGGTTGNSGGTTGNTGGSTSASGGTGTGGSAQQDGQPGVIIVLPGEIDTSCVPTCKSTTTKVSASELPLKDTQHPDGWDTSKDGPSPAVDLGEESGAYCVLDGTGKRSCVTGQYPPSFVPPAVKCTKSADGFYTNNGQLYDACGNQFIMRGISNAHVWYDTYGRYLAYDALDNIAAYKTNVLRVVWKVNGPPSLLAEVLYRIVELKMVPMVELHDATGNTTLDDAFDPTGSKSAGLLTVAKFWTQPAAIQVAQDYREYLLINIANEWMSGTNTSNYLPGYQQAIKLIRDAGLKHTLVIDAPAYGQIVNNQPTSTAGQTEINNWFTSISTLMQADTNLIFSVHMYEYYSDATQVTAILGRSGLGSTIPFIVGEFANMNNNKAVAYKDIMSQCQSKNLGWISWSWHGNTGQAAGLDMTTDWESSLTSWGQDIFTGTNGIQATAQVAGIFR